MRESCRYKKRDAIKAEAEEDSSFVFKINDRPQRTVESKRIMVDTGATLHIIKDIERFKNFHDLFQPEICLVNANGNMEPVTLKEALFVPSYPQDIFSAKPTTVNEAAITFKKIRMS